MLSPQIFQQRILDWYDQHGRKDLPWQQQKTAYKVWLSEVMLQQTQVATVIPFFLRFMRRFPSIKRLALADIDEVLALWSGLGYYARARNLHRCAQILYAQYRGRFPQQVDALEALPGIGRSTAGAILSSAYNLPTAILDGNVKRVFARCFAVNGATNTSATLKRLWGLAEYYVSPYSAANYNQALMDIGALICHRTQPQCTQCPLQTDCVAYQTNTIAQYPAKKAKRMQPLKTTRFLLLQHQDEVLLQKRPSNGIWGGLWCFPECDEQTDILTYCQQQFGLHGTSINVLPGFQHVFTHFKLNISPVVITVSDKAKTLHQLQTVWYNRSDVASLGLAKPVSRLLDFIWQEA